MRGLGMFIGFGVAYYGNGYDDPLYYDGALRRPGTTVYGHGGAAGQPEHRDGSRSVYDVLDGYDDNQLPTRATT